jgi:hypothetical protein
MKVTAPPQIREPEDLAFLSTAHRARRSLEIDLTDVEWMSPLGVAAVLATCLRADEAELETNVVYLPESLRTRTYLDKVGLVKELDRAEWTLTVGGSPQDIADLQMELPIWSAVRDTAVDPEMTIGAHLPVSRMTTLREVDAAADKLEVALKDVPHIRGGLFDELITLAVELTANAREHGSPCYVVAQVYTGQTSGTRGIQLAVADFGIGLSRTLRAEYGPMADGEAIVRAFDEQVSGTGRSDRGFGLTQVAEIVDRDPEGVLHLISHCGHVTRTEGRFLVRESEQLLFQEHWAPPTFPRASCSLQTWRFLG